MKMDLQPYFESGTIEIEKAKEFFHGYNKDKLFDDFIDECPDEKITIGKPDNTKIRFTFEDKEERYFWLVVELVPNTENNEIMKLIDIDYFDPNRDHRNG